MTIPNPEHFFKQAEELVAKRGTRPARGVDIRRAISATYYGLFHAIAAACADQFVGSTMRGKTPYALIDRALDHKGIARPLRRLEKDNTVDPLSTLSAHWRTGIRNKFVGFVFAGITRAEALRRLRSADQV